MAQTFQTYPHACQDPSLLSVIHARPVRVWIAASQGSSYVRTTAVVGLLRKTIQAFLAHGYATPTDAIWISADGNIKLSAMTYETYSLAHCLHTLGISCCELLAGEHFEARIPPALALNYARSAVEHRHDGDWNSALAWILERMVGLAPAYASLEEAYREIEELFPTHSRACTAVAKPLPKPTPSAPKQPRRNALPSWLIPGLLGFGSAVSVFGLILGAGWFRSRQERIRIQAQAPLREPKAAQNIASVPSPTPPPPVPTLPTGSNKLGEILPAAQSLSMTRCVSSSNPSIQLQHPKPASTHRAKAGALEEDDGAGPVFVQDAAPVLLPGARVPGSRHVTTVENDFVAVVRRSPPKR